jgi:DNA invertase Pin-like site-specific DNA recombinase
MTPMLEEPGTQNEVKLAPPEGRSEKIHPWHRERLAVVYVRQSTVQQVLQHQESTRLQYGLRSRAGELGWATDRVVVIDDDLAMSATTTEGRTGFQRLVAEVSLDHVGLILGVEMSRLARSNKDWHQLLEVCALFRTLLADLDGIYDPTLYNDRLLLGLKGTMSEAELHILKQRMYQGSLSKARRGDLQFALPVGYVWDAEGTIQFDPDEQVQAVVRLLFRKFEELGTLGGLLRYLVEHQIQLGIRVREGPGKGALIWRRPNRATVQMLLKHPLYSGAYVYGRRQVDPRRKQAARPQTGRVVMDPATWHAFLPGRGPAYISPEQYKRNQARLAANQARAAAVGAVRDGAALVAGLVVCPRCQVRLGVHYNERRTHHTYDCVERRTHYGEPLCQHVPGPCLDTFVSQQVLAALEPASLELSLTAAERVEQDRAELDRLWQQRRERAAYDAERAARQYHAVEPEHRLVARSLERAWEAKLAAQQELDEAYHRFASQQPRVLTAQERDAIRCLATDIPGLWSAPTTTAADRKAIIRQVVERVVVAVQGRSERVAVRIDWVGGGYTEGTLLRDIARLADLSYSPQLCARVRGLTEAGLSASAMAEQLHAEGYRPARQQARLGLPQVTELQRRLGLRACHPHRRDRPGLNPDEWWSSDLADRLELSRSSLHRWIQLGWVRARREDGRLRRWIVWADAVELARLQQLQQRSVAEEARRRWTEAPWEGAIAMQSGIAASKPQEAHDGT